MGELVSITAINKYKNVLSCKIQGSFNMPQDLIFTSWWEEKPSHNTKHPSYKRWLLQTSCDIISIFCALIGNALDKMNTQKIIFLQHWSSLYKTKLSAFIGDRTFQLRNRVNEKYER